MKKKKKKKGAFYSYFYISLWCYLITLTQHWGYPATGQSPTWLFFLGTFRQILAADKCMAPSYLSCPNPAPLLPWMGPCRKNKKSIKCPYNFLLYFFILIFLVFLKDLHAFSQWEAEQVVLSG